ncbi:hypothetical protein GXW78_07290 [Roseomonas terrae]|jgi:hypothetical protein|uniref:Uncharacterized protein n=1 Tax=Neoroseomonas terrae TaxID=424799 RepID=A0ABS5EEK6_9PROT|nr:hypothetical protein [Neoroseomonas terrae]MBR0649459.1 hypothetical protein [Neoroseomonas terrae]
MLRRLVLALPLVAAPAAARDVAFPLDDRRALALALQGQFREPLQVEEIRRFGPLAAVRFAFLQRANSTVQWAAVIRQERAILVMGEANRLAPEVQASLRPAHPDAMLEVGTQAFIRHVALPDGGARLLFALPVLAGCRACAFVAIARLGIDVDGNGAYRGTSFLGTVPASSGQGWASDPRL